MDKDFTLFDLNREVLKKIFLKLSRNERRVSFTDFQRFCVNSKIIPTLVSQNQLRALGTKLAGSSSLVKFLLTFELFEHSLKLISISKPQPAFRPDKIKLFFQFLSQSLKLQFSLDSKSALNRSNSTYSITNTELNDSNNSLDLSIKEALNTLKSDKKKPTQSGRSSISPRPAIRAYSNPSTPRARNYRGFGAEAGLNKRPTLAPTQSSRNFVKGRNKIAGELDEFLEAEKMVQKEVLSIKVNLKGNDRRKVEYKPKGSVAAAGVGKGAVKKSPQNKPSHLEAYRKIIVKTRQNTFSQQFILGIIFKAWKSLKKASDSN